MRDEPRRILCQLLILYGPELHADPRRTEALLRDHCPQYGREIFVLVNAQKQRIPAELLAAPKWMPQGALHSQLARRLEQSLAFTSEASAWAVAAWSDALRLNPARTDRIWVWLKQHAALPGTLRGRRRWELNWPRIQWRVFPHSGVQLLDSVPALRTVLRVLAVPLRWGWAQRRRLARRPVQVTGVALLCALIVMASTDEYRPRASSVADSAPQLLTTLYPLPRTAWVYAGPLTVRRSPSLEGAPLGLLVEGQEVLVVGYTPDGEWSQIQAPSPGWVNNQFLHFRSPETPYLERRLALQEAEVAATRLNVRAGPGLEYEVWSELHAGQQVTIIATSRDGAWYEIALPLHGWVSAELVTIHEDSTIRP
jgi:hypothetical protein